MSASAVATRIPKVEAGGKSNPTEPDRVAGPSKSLTPDLPSKSGQIANPPKKSTM